MNELPEMLYRGDCDPKRERRLREIWDDGYILTNLANSGSGKEIFNAPLIASVKRHVALGWEKTHFLSFTDNYETAKRYAAGKPPKKLELVPENSSHWDSLVYWCETSVFQNVHKVESGLYTATFLGHQLKTVGESTNVFKYIARLFATAGRVSTPVKVMLINVLNFIEYKVALGEQGLETALAHAKNDTEWLLLPTDPFENGGEFTAMLDKACLAGAHKFRFV